MTSLESAKFLALSGSVSIFFSTWLGVAMLFPRPPVPESKEAKGVIYKQIGAAHLDWIMLGLMQGLAGILIWLYAITLPPYVLWLMAFGAWFNPLPYVFRAFGVNAFVFAGGPVQRSAAALGTLSSTAIVVSWSIIFWTIAAH